LRAAARPPFRPAAFFWAVVPPWDRVERRLPLPELFPPRLEAPGELAIRAARAFDIPFFRSPSYCFSFLTLGRLFGMQLTSCQRWFPGSGRGNAGYGGAVVSNAILAELLGQVAEAEEGHRRRALRRAGRAAMLWPEEAADLDRAGRALTELRAVGPWVADRIRGWLDEPPDAPEPPEIRRGFMTMSEARRILAEHPSAPRARADLQMHSTWSDGRVSIEEMVARSKAIGREFVAITDHSVGLPIARGMDEPTLLRQGAEIDNLNATGDGPRILRSIEMNLSPEGEGDMDPAVLAGLDLVLGAFHSALRRTEDQTDRYLAAVRNPTVHVLAHPRGRRWGTRPGLRADWPRVFAAAAEAGTALEIDAFPDRQDLQVELLEVARDAGGWISIGSDAHSPDELDHLELGEAAAIRAGIPEDRILNLRSADEVVVWAAAKRERV
jgi:putative hydrolase